MSLEGRGSEGMFMRILSHRAATKRRKPRGECPKCGREVAFYKSGKVYRHKCES